MQGGKPGRRARAKEMHFEYWWYWTSSRGIISFLFRKHLSFPWRLGTGKSRISLRISDLNILLLMVFHDQYWKWTEKWWNVRNHILDHSSAARSRCRWVGSYAAGYALLGPPAGWGFRSASWAPGKGAVEQLKRTALPLDRYRREKVVKVASLSTHPVGWMEALSSPGFSRALAGPGVPVDGRPRIPRGDHHHLHLTSRHSGTCNPPAVQVNHFISCNP